MVGGEWWVVGGGRLLPDNLPQSRVDSPAREFIALLTRLHFAIAEFRECVLVVRDTRIRHRMELTHRRFKYRIIT